MSNKKWNLSDIPNQSDKVIIITGASAGLGKEMTKVLTGKGATVIMAVRNEQKANTVVDEIQQGLGNIKVDIQKLDLSSLTSIKAFAKRINASYPQVDILINNAGVMACPYSKTEDDFEIQMGVNHFGHFALTGLLMPLLQKANQARIVATSSVAHRQGNINFDDINWENRNYVTGKAYGDSKIANLYFAFELARKLNGNPKAPIVTAAHPGWTSTELQRHSLFYRILNPIFSQKVEQGILPSLRAAFDPNAKQGDYFGPNGFMEIKGSPVVVDSNELAKNEANAKKLWDISEKLTGISYSFS